MLELAIVIPALNERENVAELVRRLDNVLVSTDWEAVFVDDDSPDGTAEVLRTIARVDRRVRVIHRIGRRGLASACVEGIQSTSAPYIAVMDSDLQHDETLLPRMLADIRRKQLDLVVASRYVEGGSVGDFHPVRRAQSTPSFCPHERPNERILCR